VIGDEAVTFGFVVGEADGGEVIGHANADVDMAVEANAVASFGGRPKVGGLPISCIMTPQAVWVRLRLVDSRASRRVVNPDVAFG